MIKPFEETQQTKIVTKEQFSTFEDILFRYIAEAYKQFRWERKMFLSYSKNPREYIAIYTTNHGDKIQVRFGSAYDDSKRHCITEDFFFEIREQLTPKKIAEMAKEAFKFVKKEMEKIPDGVF